MSLNERAIPTLNNEWYKFKANILENKKIKQLPYLIIEGPTFSSKLGTTDEVDFEVVLKFMDVPCRANQSQCRNVEIFVRSRITYKILAKGQKKILEYNTAVQYCKKNGTNLKCIMGYHYDGSNITTQYGHPIFHMQFKNNILHDVVSARESGKFESIDRTNTDERDEVRIPTAQMDLYNTIVSLFADHLYTDNGVRTRNSTLNQFKIFLTNIESVLDKCELDTTKLFEHGPQTNSCMSNRWYPIEIP